MNDEFDQADGEGMPALRLRDNSRRRTFAAPWRTLAAILARQRRWRFHKPEMSKCLTHREDQNPANQDRRSNLFHDLYCTLKSMKLLAASATLFTIFATLASAQSPPAQTAVTLGGKTIGIHYSAPSVRHRKIFGPGGLLSMDPTYPAWRAGANSATSFHTDAALDIGGLKVSKGDYTIYAWVADPDNWQLIINKQTGQWGLDYNAKMDLGRAAK